MHTIRHTSIIPFMLLAGLVFLPHPARAAQSYDNCAGTITSLPATITTQGVWCLKKDLSTAITSGNAITIVTNNVTIDCNDFKLGGLAAGPASNAVGIYASGRQNATIRHCNVRGFLFGIDIVGGAGHLVEDNRLDNNLAIGIAVSGDNNLLRHNRVYDTGGGAGGNSSYGIWASADVIDNIVTGLFVAESDGNLFGILDNADSGAQIRDNKVYGFNPTIAGGGSPNGVYGISISGISAMISGNGVFGPLGGSIGIWGNAVTNYCRSNVVTGFDKSIYQCTVADNGGGNSNMTATVP